MNRSLRKSGFTLIEVLIVVVILAILAAAVIPQFGNSTADAKLNTSLFNLHALRSQVQLYKAQHGSLASTFTLNHLTQYTDPAGNIVTSGAAGVKYGPYMSVIPDASVLNVTTLNSVTTTTSATRTTVAGGAAWAVSTANGDVWLNDAAYLTY